LKAHAENQRRADRFFYPNHLLLHLKETAIKTQSQYKIGERLNKKSVLETDEIGGSSSPKISDSACPAVSTKSQKV
jgi:hypothetical protein